MKVECVKQKFKDAVVSAERVTGKHLALPILKNLLILATENSLKIRATNLDIGIEFTVPAKVEVEGIIAVPGDLLGNFLSNLPDEKTVRMEIVNSNLTISSPHTMTIIKGYPYEDFPTIPTVTQGMPFNIESKRFVEGIRAVMFSATLSDVKPEFNSVYCYSEGKDLVFVATDMSRLAEKRISLKSESQIPPILIPLKNVQEIVRILDNITGEITVTVSKNQIAVVGEGVYFTSRLIDGNFPDYKQILPKQKTTEVTVLVEDLTQTLRLSGLFAGKQQQILFKVYPEDKVFEIEAKRDDVGESVTRVDATLSGKMVEMGFNYKYILDVINVLSGDSITLLFDEQTKTVLIKPIPDQRFRYLVKYMKST